MTSGSVAVMVFAGCLLLCAAASMQPNGTDCAEVRRTFVAKRIGEAQIVPHSWIKGDDLEICPSIQTCCSKAMEENYQNIVKKDFKKLLQSAGAYIKILISTSAAKFRDTFLEMIQIAENSTNALFMEVYHFLDRQARVSIGQLFADLLAYIGGQEVDLEERANSFFESLFPLVFHHSVNANQRDFTEGFKNCLREAQFEIRPFSDLPDRIASQISKSFETARAFLEALHLGVEVINTTEHMDFGYECWKAFVRLTYCPHCHGLIEARPCAGMCLNVIRGCMASVSDLDNSWSEYVSALERLTSRMVGIYNIEQVLSNIDNKISETIMYVSENAVEITKKVKQKCGNPRRVVREVLSVTSQPSPPEPISKAIADTSLYMLLQNFVQKVAESKNFYSNLADRLCSDGDLVVKGDVRCWNGNNIAEYTKAVAGIGVSAQKFNPELKSPAEQNGVIKSISDKLLHVKQVLGSQVTSIPQSDSSVLVEGSGSGASFSDDEDYADASGSGDFHKENVLHFDSNEMKASVGGTPKRSHPSYLLLILFLIFYSINLQQLYDA